MRYSQLLLLFLLNFIVLCFGQQTSSSDGIQYEYYLPANDSDFGDSNLNDFVHQIGDQWELKLDGSTSNKPIEVILFMDHAHPLEFTLAADDLNAIVAAKLVPNEIYLTLENDAKEIKKIMVLWQGQNVFGVRNVVTSVYVNSPPGISVGILNPSEGKTPKYLVDYEGKVSSDAQTQKQPQPTNQPILPNGQSSANFKVSISWKDLLSDFTISFPSSIFRAKRPVPPPPTTTTIIATSTSFGGNGSDGSSTMVATAAVQPWIIIVGCVAGVLVIVGVAVGIWYFCYRKKFKKNKLPLVPPSVVVTAVDIKVPSKEVSKPVDPPKVEAPVPSHKKIQKVRSPPSQKPSKTKGEVETTDTGPGPTTQSIISSLCRPETERSRRNFKSTHDPNPQYIDPQILGIPVDKNNAKQPTTPAINAKPSVPTIKAEETPPIKNQYHAVNGEQHNPGYETVVPYEANLPPPPKK